MIKNDTGVRRDPLYEYECDKMGGKLAIIFSEALWHGLYAAKERCIWFNATVRLCQSRTNLRCLVLKEQYGKRSNLLRFPLTSGVATVCLVSLT